MADKYQDSLEAKIINHQLWVDKLKQAKAMESLGKKSGASISKSDALELALVVEADIVVKGEVAKSGKSYEVSVEFIDVATGEVIKTGSATRKYQSGISKSIDEILGLT